MSDFFLVFALIEVGQRYILLALQFYLQFLYVFILYDDFDLILI